MRNLDCEKAQEWILEDLDQSLDQDRRYRLDRHEAGCRTCRKTELAFKELWSSLTEDVQEDPGEAFWKEYRVTLNAKLDAAAPQSARFWWSWSFGWKATAALVPAMVVLVLLLAGPAGKSPVQNGGDQARQQMLLQELTDFYGPTADEVTPTAYLDRVSSNLSCLTERARALSAARWFEVEDEPSFPYL